MPLIGEYRDRVWILPRQLATADGTGEEVESWPEPGDGSGKHWARIESPVGGETLDATRQSYQTKALRFRHEVALEAVDRIQIVETGVDYAVTGIHRERSECGGWQTVCTLVG
jgi:head-tail adaptor